MYINDQKNKKVWKVETQNGIKKVNLGDSKKNKDGTWSNFTWFGCACFGRAKDVDVQEGDTITLLSGQITKDKVGDTWYTNVTIFDMEITKRGDQPQAETFDTSGFAQIEEDENLPW